MIMTVFSRVRFSAVTHFSLYVVPSDAGGGELL
jgi:hypothetical protein